MKGKKCDRGKPRFDLLPPEPILEVVKVLTLGSEKYADENWKYVEPFIKRYTAAAGRHENARQRGIVFDPETGLYHLAHKICCDLFRLWKDIQDQRMVVKK